MSPITLTAAAEPGRAADPSSEPESPVDFIPQPIEVPGLEVQRVLGHVVGETVGPTLICIGGLHGNEPAGVLAAQRVLETIGGTSTPLAGQLLFLAGNLSALRAGRRFIDLDLNRVWEDDNVARIHREGGSGTVEDLEVLQLDLELQHAIRETKKTGQPVYLLDMHSTSGPSPSFVVLEDSLVNREFGQAFPAPLVLGIEEELGGTLYHSLSRRGVIGITIETGSHRDPGTVDRAEAAIWVALETTGLLAPGHPKTLSGRQMLEADKANLPDVVEIHYRHGLSEPNNFQMLPDYEGFQAVEAGDAIATEGDRIIRASDAGYLLMPLYQPQGDDGFFLARAVNPYWMRLSAVVRHLHAERFIHWLPGVQREERAPGSPERYTVDRGVARWFALELFHLLGFHRVGPAERRLTVVRRRDG